MNPLRWLSGLLVALALGAGAMLWLQRETALMLRGELALLRDESRELARLRAENRKLAAAQPATAELERLRADRAAIGRLRAEIQRLDTRTDEKARSVAQATAPLTPAAEWRNAGRASPLDTIETLLWASSRRDVAAVAGLLTFDAAARPFVGPFFASLPPEVRSQNGSPEQLIAGMLMRDLTPVAGRVIDEKFVGDEDMLLTVRTQNQGGAEQIARHLVRRTADGWRLVIPLPQVQRIANHFGGQVPAAK